MKTLEQIIAAYEENQRNKNFDRRDMTRLAKFVKEEDLPRIGMELNEEYKGTHQPLEWTRENVLRQLQRDVEFGWEKAVNERGISSSLMYEVVQMWNWVLEEGLENFDDYAPYGKPLFIETAKKYDFTLED